MKHLRIVGLAAIIAVTVAGFVGACTASATVFCKEEKTPCGSADYGGGTEVIVEEMPENILLWKSQGKTIDECSNSGMVGITQNTGGSGSPVNIALTNFTWGTCGKSREITKLGGLEIKYVGEGRGTVIFKELAWKEGLCSFEGKNLDIGVITKPEVGKTYSTFLVDALYPRVSGFGCGETVTFAATYKITAPSPLYIAES